MKQKFFGVWRLVAANFYKPDGTLVKLYGDDPRGLFVYAENGTMSVQIMKQNRPAIPRGQHAAHALENYHDILVGYIAYFGTYSVDENARTVTHHVQASLIPNWVGSDLVREYEFSGNRMTLRTLPASLRGEIMRGELIWEKQ